MKKEPYHHWKVITKTGRTVRFFVTYLSAQQYLFAADPLCQRLSIEPLLNNL